MISEEEQIAEEQYALSCVMSRPNMAAAVVASAIRFVEYNCPFETNDLCICCSGHGSHYPDCEWVVLEKAVKELNK